MANNNAVTVEQYDVLKAKFLTVDRSYESLKALARKGECDLATNARLGSSKLEYLWIKYSLVCSRGGVRGAEEQVQGAWESGM